jgi:hypothetical protein
VSLDDLGLQEVAGVNRVVGTRTENADIATPIDKRKCRDGREEGESMSASRADRLGRPLDDRRAGIWQPPAAANDRRGDAVLTA